MLPKEIQKAPQCAGDQLRPVLTLVTNFTENVMADMLSPQSLWTNQTGLEPHRKKMANNRNAVSHGLLAEATLVQEKLFVMPYEYAEVIASERLHSARNHMRATQTIEQKRQGCRLAVGGTLASSTPGLKRAQSPLIQILERELPGLKPLVQLKNHSQFISSRQSSVALA
jgi:hypothetical protein